MRLDSLLRNIFLSLSVICAPAWGAGDITFQKVSAYLKLKNIDGAFSGEKLSHMVRLFEAMLHDFREKKSLEEPEDLFIQRKLRSCKRYFPEAICKSRIRDHRVSGSKFNKRTRLFLEYGLRSLKKASSKPESDQAYRFMIAQNIIYSIFAESYAGRKMRLQEALKIMRRLSTHLPYVPPSKITNRMTYAQAEKEARFLVQIPSETFVSVDDMAQMTISEVSKLDVPKDHHLWHQDHYIEKTGFKLWDQWKTHIEKLTSRVAKKKNPKLASDFEYDLSRDTRVVVFHKAGKSKRGSHPKIKVKDTLGITWKLKWGDELYSEAIANHLYMGLGGKHQDLNLPKTIENPLYLIFPKNAMPTPGKPCSAPRDFLDLIACLKGTKIAHGVDDPTYFARSGVIDAEMADQLIASMPRSLNSRALQREELIGSHYSKLTSVSLELRDKKVLTRGGPFSQSLLGNENDRAMRGMTLLHLLLDNLDAKDANGESVLMRSADGKWNFYQAPTDLGAAFRGTPQFGQGINFYTETFLKKSWTSSTLKYNKFLLYRSQAMENATHADLLWMARKIARLSRKDIDEAVASGRMPQFFSDLLSHKIASRRDQLAHYYGLKTPDKASRKAPDYSLFLGDASGIKHAAELLHLHEADIRYWLKQVPDTHRSTYYDPLVRNGKMSSCKDSILINLAEQYHYRIGLSLQSSDKSTKPGQCRFSYQK